MTGPWFYDKQKQKSLLNELYRRYFRKVIAFPDGTLTHHGDCATHRAFGVVYCCAPCTCGLLHDLRWLAGSLTAKIYPNYWDDELRENGIDKNTEEFKKRKEDIQELSKTIKEVCAGMEGPVGPTPEEEREINKQDWELIHEVFGEEFTERAKNKWKLKVTKDGEDKSMNYYKFKGKSPRCVESPDS
jgi:hypothetical protein